MGLFLQRFLYCFEHLAALTFLRFTGGDSLHVAWRQQQQSVCNRLNSLQRKSCLVCFAPTHINSHSVNNPRNSALCLLFTGGKLKAGTAARSTTLSEKTLFGCLTSIRKSVQVHIFSCLLSTRETELGTRWKVSQYWVLAGCNRSISQLF